LEGVVETDREGGDGCGGEDLTEVCKIVFMALVTLFDQVTVF
jgi:hypothetical protein